MRRRRPWRRDHVVFSEGGGSERVEHCDECLSAAATTSMLDVDNEETLFRPGILSSAAAVAAPALNPSP